MDLTHIQKLENLKLPIDVRYMSHYEHKGRLLYKTNTLFRDVATFMEQPENYQFYLKYMCDPERFQVIMVYLKLYEIISRFMSEDINAYCKLYALYYILRHPVYGPVIRNIPLKTKLKYIKSNDKIN